MSGVTLTNGEKTSKVCSPETASFSHLFTYEIVSSSEQGSRPAPISYPHQAPARVSPDTSQAGAPTNFQSFTSKKNAHARAECIPTDTHVSVDTTNHDHTTTTAKNCMNEHATPEAETSLRLSTQFTQALASQAPKRKSTDLQAEQDKEPKEGTINTQIRTPISTWPPQRQYRGRPNGPRNQAAEGGVTPAASTFKHGRSCSPVPTDQNVPASVARFHQKSMRPRVKSRKPEGCGSQGWLQNQAAEGGIAPAPSTLKHGRPGAPVPKERNVPASVTPFPQKSEIYEIKFTRSSSGAPPSAGMWTCMAAGSQKKGGLCNQVNDKESELCENSECRLPKSKHALQGESGRARRRAAKAAAQPPSPTQPFSPPRKTAVVAQESSPPPLHSPKQNAGMQPQPEQPPPMGMLAEKKDGPEAVEMGNKKSNEEPPFILPGRKHSRQRVANNWKRFKQSGTDNEGETDEGPPPQQTFNSDREVANFIPAHTNQLTTAVADGMVSGEEGNGKEEVGGHISPTLAAGNGKGEVGRHISPKLAAGNGESKKGDDEVTKKVATIARQAALEVARREAEVEIARQAALEVARLEAEVEVARQAALEVARQAALEGGPRYKIPKKPKDDLEIALDSKEVRGVQLGLRGSMPISEPRQQWSSMLPQAAQVCAVSREKPEGSAVVGMDEAIEEGIMQDSVRLFSAIGEMGDDAVNMVGGLSPPQTPVKAPTSQSPAWSWKVAVADDPAIAFVNLSPGVKQPSMLDPKPTRKKEKERQQEMENPLWAATVTGAYNCCIIQQLVPADPNTGQKAQVHEGVLLHTTGKGAKVRATVTYEKCGEAWEGQQASKKDIRDVPRERYLEAHSTRIEGVPNREWNDSKPQGLPPPEYHAHTLQVQWSCYNESRTGQVVKGNAAGETGGDRESSLAQRSQDENTDCSARTTSARRGTGSMLVCNDRSPPQLLIYTKPFEDEDGAVKMWEEASLELTKARGLRASTSGCETVMGQTWILMPIPNSPPSGLMVDDHGRLLTRGNLIMEGCWDVRTMKLRGVIVAEIMMARRNVQHGSVRHPGNLWWKVPEERVIVVTLPTERANRVAAVLAGRGVRYNQTRVLRITYADLKYAQADQGLWDDPLPSFKPNEIHGTVMYAVLGGTGYESKYSELSDEAKVMANMANINLVAGVLEQQLASSAEAGAPIKCAECSGEICEITEGTVIQMGYDPAAVLAAAAESAAPGWKAITRLHGTRDVWHQGAVRSRYVEYTFEYDRDARLLPAWLRSVCSHYVQPENGMLLWCGAEACKESNPTGTLPTLTEVVKSPASVRFHPHGSNSRRNAVEAIRRLAEGPAYELILGAGVVETFIQGGEKKVCDSSKAKETDRITSLIGCLIYLCRKNGNEGSSRPKEKKSHGKTRGCGQIRNERMSLGAMCLVGGGSEAIDDASHGCTLAQNIGTISHQYTLAPNTQLNVSRLIAGNEIEEPWVTPVDALPPDLSRQHGTAWMSVSSGIGPVEHEKCTLDIKTEQAALTLVKILATAMRNKSVKIDGQLEENEKKKSKISGISVMDKASIVPYRRVALKLMGGGSYRRCPGCPDGRLATPPHDFCSVRCRQRSEEAVRGPMSWDRMPVGNSWHQMQPLPNGFEYRVSRNHHGAEPSRQGMPTVRGGSGRVHEHTIIDSALRKWREDQNENMSMARMSNRRGYTGDEQSIQPQHVHIHHHAPPQPTVGETLQINKGQSRCSRGREFRNDGLTARKDAAARGNVVAAVIACHRPLKEDRVTREGVFSKSHWNPPKMHSHTKPASQDWEGMKGATYNVTVPDKSSSTWRKQAPMEETPMRYSTPSQQRGEVGPTSILVGREREAGRATTERLQPQDGFSHSLGQANAVFAMKAPPLPLDACIGQSLEQELNFIIEQRALLTNAIEGGDEIMHPDSTPPEEGMLLALTGGKDVPGDQYNVALAVEIVQCGGRSAIGESTFRRMLSLPPEAGRSHLELMVTARGPSHTKHDLEVRNSTDTRSRSAIVRSDENPGMFQALGGNQPTAAIGEHNQVRHVHRPLLKLSREQVEETNMQPLTYEIHRHRRFPMQARGSKGAEQRRACMVCKSTGRESDKGVFSTIEALSASEVGALSMDMAGYGNRIGGSSRNFLSMWWMQRFVTYLPSGLVHYDCDNNDNESTIGRFPFGKSIKLDMPEEEVRALLCVMAFVSISARKLKKLSSLLRRARDAEWMEHAEPADLLLLKATCWALQAMQGMRSAVDEGCNRTNREETMKTGGEENAIETEQASMDTCSVGEPEPLSMSDLHASNEMLRQNIVEAVRPQTSLTNKPAHQTEDDESQQSSGGQSEVLVEAEIESEAEVAIGLPQRLRGGGYVEQDSLTLQKIEGKVECGSQYTNTQIELLQGCRLARTPSSRAVLLMPPARMLFFGLTGKLGAVQLTKEQVHDLSVTQCVRLLANQSTPLSFEQMESWNLTSRFIETIPRSVGETMEEGYPKIGLRTMDSCTEWNDNRLIVLLQTFRKLAWRQNGMQDLENKGNAPLIMSTRIIDCAVSLEDAMRLDGVSREVQGAIPWTHYDAAAEEQLPQPGLKLRGGGPEIIHSTRRDYDIDNDVKMQGEQGPPCMLQMLPDYTFAKMWVTAGSDELRLGVNCATWFLVILQDGLRREKLMPALCRLQEGRVLTVLTHALARILWDLQTLWTSRGCLDKEVSTQAVIFLQYLHRFHILAGLPSLWWMRWEMTHFQNYYEAMYTALLVAGGENRDLTEPCSRPPDSGMTAEYKGMFEICFRWFRSSVSLMRSAHCVCPADQKAFKLDFNQSAMMQAVQQGVEEPAETPTVAGRPWETSCMPNSAEDRESSEVMAFAMRNAFEPYIVEAAQSTGMMQDYVCKLGQYQGWVAQLLYQYALSEWQTDEEMLTIAGAPTDPSRARFLARVASDHQRGRLPISVLAATAAEPTLAHHWEFMLPTLDFNLSEEAVTERRFFWWCVDMFEEERNATAAGAGVFPAKEDTVEEVTSSVEKEFECWTQQQQETFSPPNPAEPPPAPTLKPATPQRSPSPMRLSDSETYSSENDEEDGEENYEELWKQVGMTLPQIEAGPIAKESTMPEVLGEAMRRSESLKCAEEELRRLAEKSQGCASLAVHQQAIVAAALYKPKDEGGDEEDEGPPPERTPYKSRWKENRRRAIRSRTDELSWRAQQEIRLNLQRKHGGTKKGEMPNHPTKPQTAALESTSINIQQLCTLEGVTPKASRCAWQDSRVEPIDNPLVEDPPMVLRPRRQRQGEKSQGRRLFGEEPEERRMPLRKGEESEGSVREPVEMDKSSPEEGGVSDTPFEQKSKANHAIGVLKLEEAYKKTDEVTRAVAASKYHGNIETVQTKEMPSIEVAEVMHWHTALGLRFNPKKLNDTCLARQEFLGQAVESGNKASHKECRHKDCKREVYKEAFCSQRCWRENQQETNNNKSEHIIQLVTPEDSVEKRTPSPRAVAKEGARRSALTQRGGGPMQDHRAGKNELLSEATTLTIPTRSHFTRQFPKFKYHGEWLSVFEVLGRQQPVQTIEDGRWAATHVSTVLAKGLLWRIMDVDTEGTKMQEEESRNLRTPRELAMHICPVARYGRQALRSWESQTLREDLSRDDTIKSNENQVKGAYIRICRSALRQRGGGGKTPEPHPSKGGKDKMQLRSRNAPPSEDESEDEGRAKSTDSHRHPSRSRSKPKIYSDEAENERNLQMREDAAKSVERPAEVRLTERARRQSGRTIRSLAVASPSSYSPYPHQLQQDLSSEASALETSDEADPGQPPDSPSHSEGEDSGNRPTISVSENSTQISIHLKEEGGSGNHPEKSGAPGSSVDMTLEQTTMEDEQEIQLAQSTGAKSADGKQRHDKLEATKKGTSSQMDVRPHVQTVTGHASLEARIETEEESDRHERECVHSPSTSLSLTRVKSSEEANTRIARLERRLQRERMGQHVNEGPLPIPDTQPGEQKYPEKENIGTSERSTSKERLRPRPLVDYTEVESDAGTPEFTESSDSENGALRDRQASGQKVGRCQTQRHIPAKHIQNEDADNGTYANEGGNKRKSSKVAFYEPASQLVYCWHRRVGSSRLAKGGLDLPGGFRTAEDQSDVETAARKCKEEVILPHSLQVRLLSELNRLKQYACICKRPFSNEGHLVSLWLIPANLRELMNIRRTRQGSECSMQPGVYPFDELKDTSPYAAAIESGLEAIKQRPNTTGTLPRKQKGTRESSSVKSSPPASRSSSTESSRPPSSTGTRENPKEGPEEVERKVNVGMIIASFDPERGQHHVLAWESLPLHPLAAGEAPEHMFSSHPETSRCGFMLTNVNESLSATQQLALATKHLHDAVGTNTASRLLNPKGPVRMVVPRPPPSYWLYPGTDQPVELDFHTPNGTRYFVILIESVPRAWRDIQWMRRSLLASRPLQANAIDVLRSPFPPADRGRWLESDHVAYTALAGALSDGHLVAGPHTRIPSEPPRTPDSEKSSPVEPTAPQDMSAVVADLQKQLQALREEKVSPISTPESARSSADSKVPIHAIVPWCPSEYDDTYPEATEEQLIHYRKSHHWADLQMIMERKFSPIVMDARRHRWFLPRVTEKERSGGAAEKCISSFMANRVLIPSKRLGVTTGSGATITMADRTASWKTYLLLLVPLLREAYEGGLPVISFLIRLRSNILAELSQQGLEHHASDHCFISIINSLESDRNLWGVMKAGSHGEVLGDTSLLLDLWLELLSRNYMGPTDGNDALRRFEDYERPAVGSVSETLRTLNDYYLASRNPATNPNNLTREGMLASKEHVMNVLEHFMKVLDRDRARPWSKALKNHVRHQVDNILCEVQLNRKGLADLAPSPHNILLAHWGNYEAFLESEHERTHGPLVKMQRNRQGTGVRGVPEFEPGSNNTAGRFSTTRTEAPPAAKQNAPRETTESRLEARISKAEAGQPDPVTGVQLPRQQLRELRRQKGLLLKIKSGTLTPQETQAFVLQLRESRQNMATPLRAPPQRVNAVMGFTGVGDDLDQYLEYDLEGYEEMYHSQPHGGTVAHVGGPPIGRVREERAQSTTPAQWRPPQGEREHSRKEYSSSQGGSDQNRNWRNMGGDRAPPPPPQGNYQLTSPLSGGHARNNERREDWKPNSSNGAPPSHNWKSEGIGQAPTPRTPFNDQIWGGQRPSLIPNTWNMEEIRAFKGNTINFAIIDELIGTDAAAECARIRPLHPWDQNTPPQQYTGPQNPSPQLDPTTGKRVWPADTCLYCTNSPKAPTTCTMPPTHLYIYGNPQRNHASTRCYGCKFAVLYSKDARIRKAFCPAQLQKYTGPPGSV